MANPTSEFQLRVPRKVAETMCIKYSSILPSIYGLITLHGVTQTPIRKEVGSRT